MKTERSPNFRFVSLAVLFICLTFVSTAHAQDNVTGSFQGIVRDAQGNPLAGVTVRIVNKETGVPTATQTNAAGRYIRSLLPPGDYIISISKEDYVAYEIAESLDAMTPNVIIPDIHLSRKAAVTSNSTIVQQSPTPNTGRTSPATSPSATSAVVSQDRDLRREINVVDARRGGIYTEREVSTLPLGGITLTRTFDELGLLVVGVAPPPQTFGSVAGPGVGSGVGSAGQFAVNGMRSRANNFTVDGSDNNDEDIGVRRQGFFALVPQPIESIKEFQIITLLAPAQYGRNIGGQVNAISKGGGSETHGVLYGLFNSSQLNARNVFDTVGGNTFSPLRSGTKPVFIDGRQATVQLNNGDKDSFTLGQGGLVIGGPLVQGKLFYFFSLEGQNLNANKESHFAVPTIKQRGAFNSGDVGLSTDPITGAPLIVGAFPTSLKGDAIYSFFPFPNNPNGPYGANTYTEVIPAGAQSKLASGRFDTNFNAFERQSSLTGRYNFTQDWRDIPAVAGALFARLRPRVRTQNISLFLNTELSGSNSTSPIFNQVRFSFGRTRLIFDEGRDTTSLRSVSRKFTDPQDAQFLLNRPLLSNITRPGNLVVSYVNSGTTESEIGPVGQLLVAGFSPVGVDVFNFPQRRINNTYQLADSLTFSAGDHGVTLGTDNRRTELISNLPRNARPLVTFNGAPRLIATQGPNGATFRFAGPGDINPLVASQDFAAASAPSGFFQTLVQSGSDASINLRYYQLNFFAQDEWRISQNLALSYGLRYEYNTPPSEANRLIENTFTSPSLSLVPGLNTFIAGRTEMFEPDRNNFAPRIGFAYSPQTFAGDKVTVLRAGYGLFYDQILGAVVSQSRNVFPTFSTINFGGGCNSGCSSMNPNVPVNFNVFNPMVTTFPSGSQNVPIVQPGTLNTLNPAISLSSLVSTANRFFGNLFNVPGNSAFGATLPSAQLDMPMAHQYSVTVEQQLSNSLVVSGAYVGTLGRNLLRFTAPNLGANYLLAPVGLDRGSLPVPDFNGFTLPPGTQFSSAGAPVGGRPVNNAGAVNIFETTARSRYDAFQAQLRGRFDWAGSTQFQVNYTLSRVKDDVSDVFDLAGAPALPQDSFTFEGEYGPANFDARHRVSYNYISDLPHFENRALQVLLGGVQLAGAGHYHTGQPFTVNSLFDVNLDGNLTDRPNSTNGIVETGNRSQPLQLTVNPATLLAPVGQDGQVPRNSFRAGSLFLTSFAVIKTVGLGDQGKLVFRSEFFNPFNRANFGVPVRFLEAPGFGRAVDTVTPNRRIQFGIKLVL